MHTNAATVADLARLGPPDATTTKVTVTIKDHGRAHVRVDGLKADGSETTTTTILDGRVTRLDPEKFREMDRLWADVSNQPGDLT